ncbi:unnamed protein product [Ectocarpus fasciculatus]
MRLFAGDRGCVFRCGFLFPSSPPDNAWICSQLLLGSPHRCSERDVRWEELVHLDQAAAAGVFGLLYCMQDLSDRALEFQRRNSAQAAGRCRCSPTAPEAIMLDTCATATSAPRDVEHADSSGVENSDICNGGRRPPGVWHALRRRTRGCGMAATPENNPVSRPVGIQPASRAGTVASIPAEDQFRRRFRPTDGTCRVSRIDEAADIQHVFLFQPIDCRSNSAGFATVACLGGILQSADRGSFVAGIAAAADIRELVRPAY